MIVLPAILAGRLPVRLLLGLALAGLILAALLLGPASCRRLRGQAAEARIERDQAAGFATSAAEAIAAHGRAAQRERTSEGLGQRNQKEIRDAQGADALVDPAVRVAGLASLCRRQAYRADPRCKLFQPAAR